MEKNKVSAPRRKTTPSLYCGSWPSSLCSAQTLCLEVFMSYQNIASDEPAADIIELGPGPSKGLEVCVSAETEASIKGKVRARDRRQTRHGSRQKKPIVVIDQEMHPVKVGSVAASRKHRALTLSSMASYGSIGMYLESASRPRRLLTFQRRKRCQPSP
jgi:hypothetical protein